MKNLGKATSLLVLLINNSLQLPLEKRGEIKKTSREATFPTFLIFHF